MKKNGIWTILICLAVIGSISVISTGGCGTGATTSSITSTTTTPTTTATTPEVLSVSPTNGAASVSTSVIIQAQFNKALDPTTVTSSNFKLASAEGSVSGTVTYESSTKTAKMTASQLAYGTQYTASLETGIKDTSGNALASAYTWVFTTVASSGGESTGEADTTPPQILTKSPGSGATGVSTTLATLEVTFNEDLNPSTVNASTFTFSSFEGSVSGTVTYESSTKTAKLTATNLAATIEHTATLTTGIKDTSGNALVSNYTWSFITTPAGPGWTITFLNFDDWPTGNSIAIDSNNKVHIAYYDNKNVCLRYVTNISGSWESTTVDPSAYINGNIRLVVDSNNKIHISYFEDTNDDLKYASNYTGPWEVSTLVSTGKVGGANSLALDHNNKAHLIFYDETNFALKYISNSSGSWGTPSTIDSNYLVSTQTSMAIDSNNKIHACYYYQSLLDTIYALKYTTYTDGVWEISTVDSGDTNPVGLAPSLSLDHNNKAHISYCDSGNKTLKYATKVSGVWVPATIASLKNLVTTNSIAIDSNNQVHISYYDDNTSKKNLTYVTNTSGTWVTSTVDYTRNAGSGHSMAIDLNNQIHICYTDSTSHYLRYATNAE